MPRLDATFTWLSLVAEVLNHGHRSAPRGRPILELIGYKTRLAMANPLVEVPARAIGRKFRAAEAAWILSGDNRVATIGSYAKHIAQFSDDGEVFYGAYGPRLMPSMEYIAETLAKDRESRQAVCTIWNNQPEASKDIPCTVAVQWFIRQGKLHCLDFMRSSDIWLGWPYDVFNFSMVSYWLTKKLYEDHGLNVDLGYLTLIAGSQHLYLDNDNEEKAKSLSMHAGSNYCMILPDTKHLSSAELIEWLWEKARGEGI